MVYVSNCTRNLSKEILLGFLLGFGDKWYEIMEI